MKFRTVMLSLFLAGTLQTVEEGDEACRIEGWGALAVCKVGEGRVTVLADAGLIEHGSIPSSKRATSPIPNDLTVEELYRELRRRGAEPLIALMRFAFSR